MIVIKVILIFLILSKASTQDVDTPSPFVYPYRSLSRHLSAVSLQFVEKLYNKSTFSNAYNPLLLLVKRISDDKLNRDDICMDSVKTLLNDSVSGNGMKYALTSKKIFNLRFTIMVF